MNSLGISHFGAIPVNQIPNNEESIKGHNMRGIYWTTPDESGKEVARDINIDEEKYTQVVPEFQKTYFEDVVKKLQSKFKIGRIRILLKEPRSTLSWHRDPECRLHIPIITNPGCSMVIENVANTYQQMDLSGLQITQNITIFSMVVSKLEYIL